MKAPFPWFGGKSGAAHIIWGAFGDVDSYVEPFAGSLAVLLARPAHHRGRVETVNDLDCYVANFWRATAADADAVWHHADWPVNEADLQARHQWLVDRAEFRARMKADPDFFDAKIAGWWVWGQSAWIGSGWCSEKKYRGDLGDAGQGVHRKLPHLTTAGMGVHRKLPHLGNPGRGVHRQLPHLGDAGPLTELAARLRRVRVACGDWLRVTGESVLRPGRRGFTGVLLDPPYDASDRRQDYGVDTDVSADVRAWALEHGDTPWLRIALCGYTGHHDAHMPDGWTAVPWKAAGGYGSQGDGQGRANAAREVIWLSPHCLRGAAGAQQSLFAAEVSNGQ